MSDSNSLKLNYSFNQDTIWLKSTHEDSYVKKPFNDTLERILSKFNDSLTLNKTDKANKELIHGIDSNKIINKKNISSAKEFDSSQSGNEIITVKRGDTIKNQEKLSWNSPEDFAQLIFSYHTGLKTANDSFTSDTLMTSISIQKKDIRFFKRIQANVDWIFWTYIIITFLFVWIQIFYKKYFTNLFNSVINYHMSFKLFNERNIFARRVSVVLNFVYAVSISLIIFRIIQYLGLIPKAFDRFSLFLIILNLVILYSISKTILQKIVGFIFYRLEQINEYLHNVYVFNKSLGIILLPLSFTAFYTPNKVTEILLVAAVFFYVFSLLLKIIRGFKIIIKNDVFIFYMILYLCTLEILPIIIGYKFFKTLA